MSPYRVNLRPKRADFESERADFMPERADFGPERADSGSERARLRPWMPWGGEMRVHMDIWMYGRTDGHLEIHPCVLLDIGPLGPLPKKGVSITFSLSMNLSITNKAFLSDPKNKKQFIDFLGTKLTNQGCQVFYDQADADLLIVQKTIESATSYRVDWRGHIFTCPADTSYAFPWQRIFFLSKKIHKNECGT